MWRGCSYEMRLVVCDETANMFWVNGVPRECVFSLPTLRKVYAATDFVGLPCSNKYMTISISK